MFELQVVRKDHKGRQISTIDFTVVSKPLDIFIHSTETGLSMYPIYLWDAVERPGNPMDIIADFVARATSTD